MLRSEMVDRVMEAWQRAEWMVTRDSAVAILDAVEPLIRAEEREKWRAELQAALDELSAGK